MSSAEEAATMIKAEDFLYDAETEDAHGLVEDDADESNVEDDDDDDDEGDEEEEEEDDENGSDDGDEEVPSTPNAHSATPIHIQPYYNPYTTYYHPYPAEYQSGYMMTGPINPHAYTDASTMADPVTDTRRNRGGVTEPFPEKMHRMLDGTELEGLTDVVGFFSHGRAFAIHKPRRFVAEIMPRYFRQTRLTSFQRQLNLYGFRRISQGPDNGGYYHELFLRGRPGLCVNMKRTKVKGALKHKRDPEAEPNFYAMRPITGAAPPIQQPAQGYHVYPPYPYFPPYTAAQTGGYTYGPYYYPHWGYPPPHGSPGTPMGTPGGDSQEGDEEEHHGDNDDADTPTKDENRDEDDEENDDDNDAEFDDDE